MHALNEIASSVPIIKQWSGEIDGLARKAHCIVGVIERRGGEVRCDPGPGQSLYIYIYPIDTAAGGACWLLLSGQVSERELSGEID